jgi:hypothetical protein
MTSSPITSDDRQPREWSIAGRTLILSAADHRALAVLNGGDPLLLPPGSVLRFGDPPGELVVTRIRVILGEDGAVVCAETEPAPKADLRRSSAAPARPAPPPGHLRPVPAQIPWSQVRPGNGLCRIVCRSSIELRGLSWGYAACGHPGQVQPAGAVPGEHQHVQPLEQHRLHHQEVTGDDGVRLGGEELRQVGRAAAARDQCRPRAGSPRTADAAIACPSRASSPWIRLWPQAGFSRAIRTISALTGALVYGRPGRRRLV